jgi:hypothetical protein
MIHPNPAFNALEDALRLRLLQRLGDGSAFGAYPALLALAADGLALRLGGLDCPGFAGEPGEIDILLAGLEADGSDFAF